jgi:hypothetical protein
MLFLRNIQAQRPDSLFFRQQTEEEISQFYCSFSGCGVNTLFGL